MKRLIKKSIYNGLTYLFLLSSLTACLKEDDINLPFVKSTPIDLGDGLTISSPEDENVDGQQLDDIYKEVYADENIWSLRSLLVFRNGRLISEAYLKDEKDITQKYLIWSCTKQILALVIGQSIEDGLISDINEPISNYLDSELNNHQDKASLTLKNLITMQSGIDFENSGIGSDSDKLLRQIPDNSLDYVLGLTVNEPQGTVFHYNDGDPQILSAIIQKLAGKPTDAYADEVLFSKIGFTNYNWVRYRDGITMGAWGIETTPRELAKIALCVSNSGKWNDQQIINEDWITEMTSPHVSETTETNLSFGYFWWIDYHRDIFFMDGHGGQFAFVVPNKNLVVVMTAIPNTQDDYQILYNEAVKYVDKITEIAY